MGAGKNKAHRKKRISKHVLKAQEHQTEKGQDETTAKAPEPAEPIAKKPKKSKKNRKIKDPSEAASYLSAWKHRDAGGGIWKFNKNTQSWLIRHMYEASKVSKTTFEVLMEYLVAGGEGMRARVREDATMRALRYKEYEKSREANNETEEPSGESSKIISQPEEKEENATDEDDTARWKALSDHDKRKEYKRARKILDILKEQ